MVGKERGIVLDDPLFAGEANPDMLGKRKDALVGQTIVKAKLALNSDPD